MTDPLLVSTKEAATMLGFSVRWLKTRIASGEVPVVRAGRSVRLRRQDVLAFINHGKWPRGK